MGLSKSQMNLIIGILIVCIALIWGAAITNPNTDDASNKNSNSNMGSPVTTPQSTDSTNSEVIQTTSNTNDPIVSTTPEMTEEQKMSKYVKKLPLIMLKLTYIR